MFLVSDDDDVQGKPSAIFTLLTSFVQLQKMLDEIQPEAIQCGSENTQSRIIYCLRLIFSSCCKAIGRWSSCKRRSTNDWIADL